MKSFLVGLGFFVLYVFAPLTLMWVIGEVAQGRVPRPFAETWKSDGTVSLSGYGIGLIMSSVFLPIFSALFIDIVLHMLKAGQ